MNLQDIEDKEGREFDIANLKEFQNEIKDTFCGRIDNLHMSFLDEMYKKEKYLTIEEMEIIRKFAEFIKNNS